jgi:hypothetical protein
MPNTEADAPIVEQPAFIARSVRQRPPLAPLQELPSWIIFLTAPDTLHHVEAHVLDGANFLEALRAIILPCALDRNMFVHSMISPAQEVHALPSRRIGIGGNLAAPALPHHRTYGSRLRRFGGFSGWVRLRPGSAGRARRSSAVAARSPARGSDSDATGRGPT